MLTRVALVAGALVLAAAALWHPAPRPAFQAPVSVATASSDAAGRRPRRATGAHSVEVQDALVYVAGAVRRPGLYRVRPGERVAAAITSAGGASDAADLNAVNLAARALDGDEIYVPVRGESPTRTPVRRYRANRREPGAVRSRAAGGAPPIAPASVDVNASDGATLERVPGIGRAIAGRIVEMRQLDGPFASTDELLDVAGMTQARLDRALPFLRPYP